jgi:hypothetical protein
MPMSALPKVMFLTTVRDGDTLGKLRNCGTVVPLALDTPLHSALDALDVALDRRPPTSLAKAKATWLPLARDLGDLLSQQIARAGAPAQWDRLPEQFSHIVLAAERVIPVDLIPCRDVLLGTECVISHSVAVEAQELSVVLLRSLESKRIPLRRIAHVCTYDAGETSLHDMDVVAATLKINNRLAIEHYFYPPQEVAAGLFNRSDLDLLHFECHGTPTSLQIDNPFGEPCDVRTLQTADGPRAYFFLGCQVGGHVEGVAPTFVRKGAKIAIGSYCTFLSGGDSGEVATSAYYDGLYQGLLSGARIGESVRAGRRAAGPNRIYYCAWLLFGDAGLTFSLRPIGR